MAGMVLTVRNCVPAAIAPFVAFVYDVSTWLVAACVVVWPCATPSARAICCSVVHVVLTLFRQPRSVTGAVGVAPLMIQPLHWLPAGVYCVEAVYVEFAAAAPPT